jgi:hypothetical protein
MSEFDPALIFEKRFLIKIDGYLDKTPIFLDAHSYKN